MLPNACVRLDAFVKSHVSCPFSLSLDNDDHLILVSMCTLRVLGDNARPPRRVRDELIANFSANLKETDLFKVRRTSRVFEEHVPAQCMYTPACRAGPFHDRWIPQTVF